MSSVDSTGPSVNISRPDIMIAQTTVRPTPKPPRVSFGEVLAAGAGVAAAGASTVLSALPGSSMSAPGVRQGGGTASPMVMQAGGGGGTMTAEGPGAIGSSPALSAGGGIGTGTTGGLSVGGVSVGSESGGDSGSSMTAALNASAALSMQYLQLQQQEDAQNRQYEAESNIEKTRHDTAKNAIGNVGQ